MMRTQSENSSRGRRQVMSWRQASEACKPHLSRTPRAALGRLPTYRAVGGGCLTLMVFLAIGRPAASDPPDPPPGPPGTFVQLPTFGVAIDALGVLTLKSFPDPRGRLHARRVAAARGKLAGDLRVGSGLRKISLVRLERAIAERLGAGQPLTETMSHLAGLQRLQYVFCYPDQHDIILAGPAEGFVADGSGRMVGITSGRPVLLLEDLLVALRAFPPTGRKVSFIGCTISPPVEGLKRLQAFQRTIPSIVPQSRRQGVAIQVALGMRRALGAAEIRAFGISPKTRFAQTLIEADFRMKRIGMGLEPKPVPMTSFIEALATPRHATLQRWWFTPDYDCVKIAQDGLAMELVGQSVQLHGEDKQIQPDGRMVDSGRPASKANQRFTGSFTAQYAGIAARVPVYAHMRNLIDMAVAAAFIRRNELFRRADWEMTTLGDNDALPVDVMPEPQRVACLVNSIWKGNRLLSLAGGVSIIPEQALAPERLIEDRDGKLGRRYQQLDPAPLERWWWD